MNRDGSASALRPSRIRPPSLGSQDSASLSLLRWLRGVHHVGTPLHQYLPCQGGAQRRPSAAGASASAAPEPLLPPS
eukprot:6686156-Prymnesium_polylepis.1